MSVNAREEEYQEVELFGKPALFTNSRIAPGTVPEGWFCYDLRGSDYDPGRPVTIEPRVVVNHAGAILVPEPVKFRKDQTFRRLRGGLNFAGGNVGLKEFCEAHGITYPEDNQKYRLRPASESEAGLFYAHSFAEEQKLGCVGNVRIDFGHKGQEFWHTWWPSYDKSLNTPEFKNELNDIVESMRSDVLKTLLDMDNYCHEHGGKISGGYQQNYGYVVETENYRYCLRCTPIQGDYNAYLFVYDKRQQALNMTQKEEIIGKVTFASGETLAYTDPAIFLQVIRDELPYKPTSGFQYEVLTGDPAVRKAADDILHNMFGEENPRPLEDYGLTEQGRRALRDAENPNLTHKYSWFVVENFCRDGEIRHDFESLTGAIDKFNSLSCAEKRLCVTKDDVSTIYLAIAHDGETRLDEGWQKNPRFAADTAINEAAERLQLSIAGLGNPSPTMTMGGLQL